MKIIYKLFFLCELIIASDAYRILAIFPFSSRSHHNVFEGVTRGLAKRGHQVDVIAHFEMKDPPKSYRTIINLSGDGRSVSSNLTIDFASQLGDDLVRLIALKFGNELCDLLGHEGIQKLIKNPPNDPPYDILIAESFAANCFFGIGRVLKVPVVAVSVIPVHTWVNDAMGNLDSIAFAPNILMDSADVSNFWERLKNWIMYYSSQFEFYWLTEDVQTNKMRKYLSPDMPNIREVEKSVALTFVNTYHTFFGVKSRVPSMVDIAGIHIEDAYIAVSPSLQKWLDESSDGVVLFTLGSMVIIETLPEETLLAIYASFKKIAPIRVLMKITNKEKLPPGLPKNVLTSKWIPQLQVLRHNNTRAFITHAGLLSAMESLYYGVPIIGVPLFGDQFPVIRKFVKKNMSVYLDYKKLTEKDLDEALDAVLNNPKYREATEHENRLFRDRPMTATETVNFWVEYVIRNGPDALRSPSRNMPWWKLALLDVYGFLLLSSAIIIYLFIFVIKHVICAFFKSTKPKAKAQTHRKRE